MLVDEEALDWRVLEKWADDFRILGHPKRLLILMALYVSDELQSKASGDTKPIACSGENANSNAHRCLTFSQLEKYTGIPGPNLDYHLKEMTDAKFVSSDYIPCGDTPGTKRVRVYFLTEKGKKALKDFGLIDIINALIKEEKTS